MDLESEETAVASSVMEADSLESCPHSRHHSHLSAAAQVSSAATDCEHLPPHHSSAPAPDLCLQQASQSRSPTSPR